MNERLSEATGQYSTASGFPKTTNQDFHSDDVFHKAYEIGKGGMDK